MEKKEERSGWRQTRRERRAAAIKRVLSLQQARQYVDLEPAEYAKRLSIYLDALNEGKLEREALASAGIPYRNISVLLQESEEFGRVYEAAKAQQLTQLNQRIDETMVRRGVEGWDEPVFRHGRQVGTVHKYSDTLLIKLAEACDPKRWSMRIRSEHSGPGGVPLPVLVSAPKESVEMEKWAEQAKKIVRSREEGGEGGEVGEGAEAGDCEE